MHVPPAFRDVADQFVLRDVLAVLHGRDDVPVAVLTRTTALDDRDVLGALDVDDAGLHRIDGSPIGPRDIDAEVKSLPALVPDSRVAEERPHGVLLIERLERPAVAHPFTLVCIDAPPPDDSFNTQYYIHTPPGTTAATPARTRLRTWCSIQARWQQQKG